MKRSLSLAALMLLPTVLLASLAFAHREPAPGKDIVLALPTDLAKRTIDAHLNVPMVVRTDGVSERERLAHPELKGHEGWRSPLLKSLERSPDATTWTLSLKPKVSRNRFAQSLRSCLTGARWPGRALRAAGVKTKFKNASTKNALSVNFSRAVGPFVELLEGCVFVGERSRGTFAPDARSPKARLTRNRASLSALPILSSIEFQPEGTNAADISLGGPGASGAAALRAPVPDVVLILQSSKSISEDPLSLAQEGGRARLITGLAPDLLLAVYWAGQGRRLEGILPNGMAPARPLKDMVGFSTPMPLALTPLDAASARVSIRANLNDPLIQGTVERLSVLFRSQGVGISEANAIGEQADLVIFRWRPMTLDPALALLALSSASDILNAEDDAGTFDPNLLATDAGVRLTAAMALERRWVDANLVVPLMSAERWYAINQALRDVRIRTDGVPILDDAFIGAAQ